MGQQYFLIKQLELKDIRLVYAPRDSIGSFGGLVDNWQWPRHTGDVTFYRAYVAPDGSPAEYSPDNVPYRPKHYLRIADEPLKKHDFVMVAGYPGRTQRWRTAEQIRFLYEQDSPNRIRILKEVTICEMQYSIFCNRMCKSNSRTKLSFWFNTNLDMI